MTMLRGIKKEDNLIMIMECIIYDNNYLKYANIANKRKLLEGLQAIREDVNALNSIRIDRAIKIIEMYIKTDTAEVIS